MSGSGWASLPKALPGQFPTGSLLLRCGVREQEVSGGESRHTPECLSKLNIVCPSPWYQIAFHIQIRGINKADIGFFFFFLILFDPDDSGKVKILLLEATYVCISSFLYWMPHQSQNKPFVELTCRFFLYSNGE